MNKIFSIAIDGPAGAGKSTVAKAVAKALGAVYLDTGAMYRTIALYMVENNIQGADSIARAVNDPHIEIRFIDNEQHMLLNGEDVTGRIRSQKASMLASQVSAIPAVRARLVALQQEFAQGHSVVMDGRDIGTVVLPNATLKIYLIASCEVRARRRFLQLAGTDKETPYEKILPEIIQRDYNDSNRAASPMRQAEDAVRLDTSDLSQDEVIDQVLTMARKAINV